MVNSHGYRHSTRHLFARKFKKHGMMNTTQYLSTYRLGDVVDIKVNGAVHKGMPFKFYQGRTGVVWNVTPHAVGVEVNKQVRHRIVKKRLHVRIEHVAKSKSRESFLKRVRVMDQMKREASARNERIQTKRVNGTTKPSHFVSTKNNQVRDVAPQPYQVLI